MQEWRLRVTHLQNIEQEKIHVAQRCGVTVHVRPQFLRGLPVASITSMRDSVFSVLTNADQGVAFEFHHPVFTDNFCHICCTTAQHVGQLT